MQRDRDERQELIYTIAIRAGTAREIAERYGTTTTELRRFVADNREAIEAEQRRQEGPEDPQADAATLTPTQLEDLWITNKFERLKRLQQVSEKTEEMITSGGMSVAEMTMAVREFRSYLMLAANELGQLLHRGSGDAGTGDSLSVDIQGIDMENLR